MLAAIVLSALGIAASLYSFHALVTRFYVTKENLVYVSTRAEFELSAGRFFNVLERGVVKPIIHKTFPLAQAAEAHRLMEASTHIGKLILVC